MTQRSHILIVEDEEAIRNGLSDLLIFHGYSIGTADEGKAGLKLALSGKFDLILLDVMLPGMNGFDICEAIREQDKEQAIIMLTAKTTDDDIIQGLKLGADDYVSKPFSVAQLVLRIEAVLRRTLKDVDTGGQIVLSDSIIDCLNLSGERQGQTVSFTRREMDILQYLYANQERPVTRDELLNKVWGYSREMSIETRTVDIHIAKLRRKIEVDPAKPESLVTVRGAGYRLKVPG